VTEELPVTHPLFHFYVQEATRTSDLLLLEQVNKVCVDFLCKKGIHGNVLRHTAPKLTKNQRKPAKTKSKSEEEIVNDLASAERTQSATFVSTGGGALNSDIAIKAGAVVLWKRKQERDQKLLKQKAEAFKRQKKADKILSLKKPSMKDYTVAQLTDLG